VTEEVTGPHSKIEAEGAWNNDNPEDKISRSVPVWYDLDKYVIRRVDGKVVGIAGYSDKGTYAILGGMKSKEGSRSWKPMANKRDELIGDKPKIAGFRTKETTERTVGVEEWKQKNRDEYKFEIPPKDTMGIDEELIEQFKERYGDDYGIRKWFELLKINPSNDIKKFDWRYGLASQYKSPKLSTFNIEDKSSRLGENFIDFTNNLSRKIVNHRLTPAEIKMRILAHNYAFNQITEAADALEKKTNNRKLKRALNKIKEAIK